MKNLIHQISSNSPGGVIGHPYIDADLDLEAHLYIVAFCEIIL